MERIPEELISPELIAGEGLSIDGTKLLCQPISLFYHDYDFIKAYYDEPKIHLNETKVVFLGDGEAGKSHIIERIFNDGNILTSFKQQSTPGIDIKKETYQIGTENMCLQFWDFGGQEIMHSMHCFFLTERTLYVIVLNARDNTQDERAKYWLNNIKSFASGCPVILVLNKIDQNQSGSLNETLLRSDYPQIEHVMKMSAKEDSKEQFDVLLKTIQESVKEFDSYAMEFPKSWSHIKAELTEMDAHYITDEVYRNICVFNGVEDRNIQDWLLEWFHDLGVSFNYKKKDILLGGYMVLKPKWITNAIYNILFNGKECSQNGIIKTRDIAEMLQNPTRTVDSSIKYKIEELPYILGVMRRFEISYHMNEDNEFIPMMCDKNENAEAASFLNQDSILEYYMEYEYLPNNVLHKLMIKMRNDIDMDKIWLTGVIFRPQDYSASALVRMHDDKIEIFVRENQEGLCCEPDFTIDMVAKSKKTSEDKEYELLEIANDLYVYNTIAFVGKNASGKTSAIELLECCYSILGDFRLENKHYEYEGVELEIIFYHDEYIYCYTTKLNADMSLGNKAVFSEQHLYKKKYYKSNVKNLVRIDEHNYKIAYQDDEKIMSDRELVFFLSSGTTKGILLYVLMIASLQKGFDLLIDEIENHFHKTLVENMICLYKDKNVNQHNASLIFTTHYCEILDLFNRRDNIWIARSQNQIS